jgi:hypothetical protein
MINQTGRLQRFMLRLGTGAKDGDIVNGASQLYDGLTL